MLKRIKVAFYRMGSRHAAEGREFPPYGAFIKEATKLTGAENESLAMTIHNCYADGWNQHMMKQGVRT